MLYQVGAKLAIVWFYFTIALIDNVVNRDWNGKLKVEESDENILVYITDYSDNIQLYNTNQRQLVNMSWCVWKTFLFV